MKKFLKLEKNYYSDNKKIREKKRGKKGERRDKKARNELKTLPGTRL